MPKSIEDEGKILHLRKNSRYWTQARDFPDSALGSGDFPRENLPRIPGRRTISFTCDERVSNTLTRGKLAPIGHRLPPCHRLEMAGGLSRGLG